MERPIILLKLSERIRTKLQSMGFECVEDIERCIANYETISPFLRDFLKENGILEKINALKQSSRVESAADLLVNSRSPIHLFHQGLAKLLNGGLPVGRITELCGASGSGKTQMCLQFCVDVQIPHELGGSAGEALYISTDFGFQIERLEQIAEATCKHFNSVENSNCITKEKCLKKLSTTAFLDGVKVLRIFELSDIYKAIEFPNSLFEAHRNIKLVVFDSFSLPLILHLEDPIIRTKTVAFILSKLLKLAIKYEFALVLTNQLMTIVSGENSSVVKPALGQAYAHRIHQRLILRNGKVFLTKSVNQPQIFTSFKVTLEGIR